MRIVCVSVVWLIACGGTETPPEPETPPEVSIADATIVEGSSEDFTIAEVTVTLSHASPTPVTISWGASTGTAQPEDFTAAGGTLELAPGVTSGILAIPIAADQIFEPDETIVVQLAGADGATIAAGTALLTIDDDEATPMITILDLSLDETATGATFVLSLSGVSQTPVVVGYAITVSTATTDDLVPDAGMLTFAPGEVQQQIPLTLTDDLLDEDPETFDVTLSDPSGAELATTTAVVTIVDDDPEPVLSVVSAVQVNEGSTGTSDALVSVTLSAPSGRSVGFSFVTAGGSATGNVDYSTISGASGFAAGTTSMTVAIPIHGDTLVEPIETFDVQFASVVNASAANTLCTVSILADDIPTLAIADASVAESSAATFTLSLSGPAFTPVVVGVSTTSNTAIANVDFTPVTTTVTFAVGETTKTVTVPVTGDTLDENDETFSVAITVQQGQAQLVDAAAIGTILDDDPTPSISIDDPGFTEGSSGGTTPSPFALTLSAASGRNVAVTFLRTAGTATANDLAGNSSGTVVIPAGSTSAIINLSIVADLADDADQETFTVTLSNPANATIGDGTGIGTIFDDDPTPSLSVVDASGPEGNGGPVQPNFCRVTIVLSSPSNRTITFNSASTGGTATSNVDYQAWSATGQTFLTAGAFCIGDTTDEPNETIIYTISNPTNATIGDGTGVFTILDDD